jgi:mono/diheme cytochrome c family protein
MAPQAKLEQRLRPERGAKSPSESAWGWGPKRSEKSGLGAASQLVAVLIALAVVAGCRQDMHNQPKYRPLRASAFFEDTSSARPLVEGTIARGTLQTDAAFFTGKNGAMLVNELPFPVTQAVLDRGQERFNIYCTPCHDTTGSGNGLVVQRGYPRPQTYHSDRLRNAEMGYFFDVMTNGFGRMPDYRAQISPRDRWNIVAYIRALQLSQHASKADVPGGDPTKVPKPAAATGEHGAAKH